MPSGIVTDHSASANEKLREEFEKAVADLATIRTAFNTLVAKLNADAGVTDANYATIGALTAAAVTRR